MGLGTYYNLVKGLVVKSKTPNYFVFYVTNLCNARCKMCFNWDNIVKAKKKEELTLQEIDKISKNMGFLQYVTLGGGEPFLRKDLPEICRIFCKNNKAQIFSIPTNAVLPKQIRELTHKILVNCKNSLVRVSLSLDGIGKDHDEIRGVKGNFELFMETYRLLDELRSRYKNLEINVGTTFSMYNQEKVKSIVDFVDKNLKITQHNITLVRGNPKEKEAKKVSIDTYGELVKYLEKQYNKKYKILDFSFKKMFAALSILTYKTVLGNLQSKRRIWDCYPIDRLIVIDPYGNVYPCEYIYENLGSLRKNNYNIHKILNSEKARRIKRMVRQAGCNCTWECAIQNSLVYNCKNYPKILKRVLKL